VIDNQQRTAPELRVAYWLDGAGQQMPPLQLSELSTGYKILYCFQAWCPSCHLDGFPTLKKLMDGLANEKFGFAVVQTVFEGEDENRPDRLVEMQDKYNLRIPFGHDQVEEGDPTIMEDYATGGTPWFIVIDPQGDIVFSDHRLDADALINSFKVKKGSN
jgi:hypothetical protein